MSPFPASRGTVASAWGPSSVCMAGRTEPISLSDPDLLPSFFWSFPTFGLGLKHQCFLGVESAGLQRGTRGLPGSPAC